MSRIFFTDLTILYICTCICQRHIYCIRKGTLYGFISENGFNLPARVLGCRGRGWKSDIKRN